MPIYSTAYTKALLTSQDGMGDTVALHSLADIGVGDGVSRVTRANCREEWKRVVLGVGVMQCDEDLC